MRHAFLYISWLRHEKFPRESERERESSLPFSPSSLPSFFFLREFLSCALLSERLEQANFFKTFKASYFLLNSYIWCFLAEKSNLRVQKNNTLNLERKEVRDKCLKNLGFSIRRYQNYRKCMEKLRFSRNWSRTSLHSRFSVLFLWTPGQHYCVALWKSYLSLLVLHYLTRWYCLYLTTVGSFGIAQWPG